MVMILLCFSSATQKKLKKIITWGRKKSMTSSCTEQLNVEDVGVHKGTFFFLNAKIDVSEETFLPHGIPNRKI